MAAESNNYAQIGVINRFGAGASLIDKEMDDLIPRKNDIPLEGARFFRKVTADTLVHKEGTVGSGLEQPVIQEDSDDLRYVTPAPGFDITLTAQTLRSAIRVTRTLNINQRIKKVNELMSGLMDSARRNLEYAFSDVFNNAFAAAVVGADGLSLCNDSHPNEMIMTGTWDNVQTAGALTPASYSTMRVAFSNRTSETGEVMPMSPDMLMVAPANEEKGWQILESNHIPDSTLLGKNWNQGNTGLFVYHYLTDANNYFLIDNSDVASKGGLIYFEKESPQIREANKKEDIIFAEYLRMTYATGFSTSKAIEGNAGA
jgi:hypothetical protein